MGSLTGDENVIMPYSDDFSSGLGDNMGGPLTDVKRRALINSALIAAARAGDTKTVQSLISKRANLETRKPMAMISVDPETLPELDRTQALVEGMTPLMHAAR